MVELCYFGSSDEWPVHHMLCECDDFYSLFPLHSLFLLLLLTNFSILALAFSSHIHRHLSLLSHSFACVIPAFSHHGFSTTPPHLHLSSVPPPSPPTLFTASLLHPRHPLSYRWLPLSNTPPMLLSFSFPISSLTPSFLPTLPPQLRLFRREYWLANLTVYLQCLVLSRRRG